jgi:regulator of nucleoside diphosphate kinase
MSALPPIHIRRSHAKLLSDLLSSAHSARDALGIVLLDEELARATIVDDDALPKGVVALGSKVRFLDCEMGRESQVELVLPAHADPARGAISVLSHAGSALIGLQVGATIDWRQPGGRTRRYRVLEVG